MHLNNKIDEKVIRKYNSPVISDYTKYFRCSIYYKKKFKIWDLSIINNTEPYEKIKLFRNSLGGLYIGSIVRLFQKTILHLTLVTQPQHSLVG